MQRGKLNDLLLAYEVKDCAARDQLSKDILEKIPPGTPCAFQHPNSYAVQAEVVCVSCSKNTWNPQVTVRNTATGRLRTVRLRELFF